MSDEHCVHKTLEFAEGAFILRCRDCARSWIAVTNPNSLEPMPDYSRRWDSECALRTRPISEPPPAFKYANPRRA